MVLQLERNTSSTGLTNTMNVSFASTSYKLALLQLTDSSGLIISTLPLFTLRTLCVAAIRGFLKTTGVLFGVHTTSLIQKKIETLLDVGSVSLP